MHLSVGHWSELHQGHHDWPAIRWQCCLEIIIGKTVSIALKKKKVISCCTKHILGIDLSPEHDPRSHRVSECVKLNDSLTRGGLAPALAVFYTAFENPAKLIAEQPWFASHIQLHVFWETTRSWVASSRVKNLFKDIVQYTDFWRATVTMPKKGRAADKPNMSPRMTFLSPKLTWHRVALGLRMRWIKYDPHTKQCSFNQPFFECSRKPQDRS